MKKKLKFAFVIFRNVLIVFFVFEIVLGIFYYYYDNSGGDTHTEFLIASGVHDGSGLSDEDIKIIHRELRQQNMVWEPYLHYRLEALDAKFTKIDKRGLRKTANPALKDAATSLKIFCFGGSTMYGIGARDTHTIPSELSKIIYQNFPDINVEITNFGCHGYTRAMENIQLQRELVHNNIPDIVIFYDGVNEVIAAHENNKVGTPTNTSNRINEFKVSNDYKKRLKLMITASNLSRFITAMQRKIFPKASYEKLSSRPDSLTIKIAETYVNFVKLSKSLENEYGFKVFNFMQPQIYSKKSLSETEKIYFKQQQYYENLYKLSYDAVRKNALMINDETFVDISNVFDTTDATIYFDFCHAGENGNRLVATEMFTHIQPELMRKTKDSVTITKTKQLTKINQ